MLSANLCLWQVHHEMLVPRGPVGDDSNMGLVSVVFDPSSLCHTRSSQTSGPIIPCLVCGVCVVLVSCLAFISFPSEAAAAAAASNSNLPPRVPWSRFAGRCDRYHRYRSTPSRALSILWCFLLPWPKPPLQPSWLVKTCAPAGRDSVAFFIIVL